MMRNGERRAFADVIAAVAAFWFAIFFAVNLASGASEQTSKNVDPNFITIGAGGFDVNDNETAGQFEVQVRLNTRLRIFKPQVGMFFTTAAGFYAYLGIMADIFLGSSFAISPSFAAGVNHEGEGKELGGSLQFRSAIELAYRFEDRSRLGIQVGHLSNAGIYAENPGTEFAILNYSVPTRVFSR